jgi:HAMP domain-containing protein
MTQAHEHDPEEPGLVVEMHLREHMTEVHGLTVAGPYSSLRARHDPEHPELIAAAVRKAERNERTRRDIAEAISSGDPSIVTNVIHALVTEHGDLTRMPADEVARLASSAYRRLYERTR